MSRSAIARTGRRVAGTTSMTGVDGGTVRRWLLHVPRARLAWSAVALLAACAAIAGVVAWLLAPAWLEQAVPFALAVAIAAAGALLMPAALAHAEGQRRVGPQGGEPAAPAPPPGLAVPEADAPGADAPGTDAHDELTQLLSQATILQRLERSIEQVRASGGCALLYLDLDEFKQVHDARGHAVGDLLLIEVAQRLQGALRGADAVGRMGESAFAVVLAGVSGAEQARRSARRLAAAIREPYVVGGVTLRIDVSMGVALFPGDGECAAALLGQARDALDRVKAGGRSAVAFSETPAALADTRLMEEELQRALEREQFEMAYQPVFGARSDVPLAYEAQVGWRHPARGLVPASVFMPLCERSPVMEKLGRWMLHTACTEAATWAVPVRLSINVGGAQFSRGDLEHLVIETLHRSGLAAERLDIEVTEAVLLEHSQQVLASMLPLRTLGVRLVVDDFGHAAVTPHQFRDGAFQQVKLNRDAVRSMLTDPGAMAVVRSALDMGAEMQIEVAAEGVEQQAQHDTLTHLGCAQMQGGLLGPPQSPERTREFLWQATRRVEGGAVLLGTG